MGAKKFTLEAELLWGTVPKEAQGRILANVWCGNCRDSVEIVDFTARVKKGDVVLRGHCRVCGSSVCRVVETSEAPPLQN